MSPDPAENAAEPPVTHRCGCAERDGVWVIVCDEHEEVTKQIDTLRAERDALREQVAVLEGYDYSEGWSERDALEQALPEYDNVHPSGETDEQNLVERAETVVRRLAEAEEERDSLAFELKGLEQRRLRDNEHLIAERDALKAAMDEHGEEGDYTPYHVLAVELADSRREVAALKAERDKIKTRLAEANDQRDEMQRQALVSLNRSDAAEARVAELTEAVLRVVEMPAKEGYSSDTAFAMQGFLDAALARYRKEEMGDD